MNLNYLFADLISRINMGNRHRVRTLWLPYNKMILELVLLLINLGLLRGMKIKSKKYIWVNMRFKNGFHIFYKLSLISKPSKRVYWNLRRIFLEVDNNNQVIFVLSTRKGLLVGSECLWQTVSGEVLLKIII